MQLVVTLTSAAIFNIFPALDRQMGSPVAC